MAGLGAQGGAHVVRPTVLPMPPRAVPKPSAVPVVKPSPVPEIDTDAVAYAAWITEQNEAIVEDMRAYRVLMQSEVVRALVDELKVFLPGPESHWSTVSRATVTTALRAVNANVGRVVQALTSAESMGDEQGVKLAARQTSTGTEGELLLAIRSLQSTLHDLVFSALKWPERDMDAGWMLRHIVLGQGNHAWLSWATDADHESSEAYLRLAHPDLDWRAPGSSAVAAARWKEHEAHERKVRIELEDKGSMSERAMRMRLDHFTPGGSRTLPSSRVLLSPTNPSLVAKRGMHWSRLYTSMWRTMSLPGPAVPRLSLPQLLLPMDGLRPQVLVHAALGIWPWVVRVRANGVPAPDIGVNDVLAGKAASHRLALYTASFAANGHADAMVCPAPVLPVPSSSDVPRVGLADMVTLGTVTPTRVQWPPGSILHALHVLLDTDLVQPWLKKEGGLAPYLGMLLGHAGLDHSPSSLLHGLLALASSGPLLVLEALEEGMREEGWFARVKTWLGGTGTEEKKSDLDARRHVLHTFLLENLLGTTLQQVTDHMVHAANGGPPSTVERCQAEHRLVMAQYNYRLQARLQASAPVWYTGLQTALETVGQFGAHGPLDLGQMTYPAVPRMNRAVVTMNTVAAVARTALVSTLLRTHWANWRTKALGSMQGYAARVVRAAKGLYAWTTEQEHEDQRISQGVDQVLTSQVALFREMLPSSMLEMLGHTTVGAALYAYVVPVFNVPGEESLGAIRAWILQCAVHGGLDAQTVRELHMVKARYPTPPVGEPGASMCWMIDVVLAHGHDGLEWPVPLLQAWYDTTEVIVYTVYGLREGWSFVVESKTPRPLTTKEKENRQKTRGLYVDTEDTRYPGSVLIDLATLLSPAIRHNLVALCAMARTWPDL